MVDFSVSTGLSAFSTLGTFSFLETFSYHSQEKPCPPWQSCPIPDSSQPPVTPVDFLLCIYFKLIYFLSPHTCLFWTFHKMEPGIRGLLSCSVLFSRFSCCRVNQRFLPSHSWVTTFRPVGRPVSVSAQRWVCGLGVVKSKAVNVPGVEGLCVSMCLHLSRISTLEGGCWLCG